MLFAPVLATVLLTGLQVVQAQQRLWQQCGGVYWQGPVVCVEGAYCKYYNQWYSQCIPSSIPSTTSLMSSTTTVESSTTPETSETPTPTPTPTPTTESSSSSASSCTVNVLRPRATGPPILASTPNTPVYGLELGNSGDVAILTSYGYHQGWSFNDGVIGAFYWSFNCAYYMYLNIGSSAESYKPLVWSRTKINTDWVYSSGGPFTTKATSPYGAVSTFLSCGNRLYLQTGTDTPSNQTCVITELTLGGL